MTVVDDVDRKVRHVAGCAIIGHSESRQPYRDSQMKYLGASKCPAVSALIDRWNLVRSDSALPRLEKKRAFVNKCIIIIRHEAN
jgi:hypothetical protein